jgi:hypothetical protein
MLLLASLAGAGSASAAPTIGLSASFAEGAKLGEPSAASFDVTIAGSEYEGGPASTNELTLRLPSGTTLTGSGFASCAKSTLEPSGQGPKACPAGSADGPVGSFSAMVAFGDGREEEKGTIEAFTSPAGGLWLLLFGHEPVLVEVLGTGHYVAGSGADGPAIVFELPLEETVPGAPFVSLESLRFQLGATREEGGRLLGSILTPSSCSGSMEWGASGVFGEPEGEGQDASASVTSPCLPESAARIAEEAERKKLAEEAERRKLAEEAERKKLAEAAAAAEAQAQAAKQRAEAAITQEEQALMLGVRSLAAQLLPRGKKARTPQVLAHGGYAFAVPVPAGDRVTISWYEVPPGRHRKAVQIAAGTANAAASGATKIFVRLNRTGHSVFARDKPVPVTARILLRAPSGLAAVKLEMFRLFP